MKFQKAGEPFYCALRTVGETQRTQVEVASFEGVVWRILARIGWIVYKQQERKKSENVTAMRLWGA